MEPENNQSGWSTWFMDMYDSFLNTMYQLYGNRPDPIVDYILTEQNKYNERNKYNPEYIYNRIKNIRIAPPASTRYKNSKRIKTKYGWYDAEGVEQNVGKALVGSNIPARIIRYEQRPGDTVYVETPERQLGPFQLGLIKERTASTLYPKGNEYDILSRRYREAMQYANDK